MVLNVFQMKNRWTLLRKRACKGNLVMEKVEVCESASSAQEKSITIDFFRYLLVMCLKLTCLHVNLILDLLLHFYLRGIFQEKP